MKAMFAMSKETKLSRLIVEASAPSNIALIKYMGKSDVGKNEPANPSLSYTLEKLRTTVMLEVEAVADNPARGPQGGSGDIRFETLSGDQVLSQAGIDRFVAHFRSTVAHMGLEDILTRDCRIRSGNNFPADCGLASSASSFAALTLAVYELLRKLDPLRADKIDRVQLSAWSREGSGSSCRSFFGPFAVWSGDHAEPQVMNTGLGGHLAIGVSTAKKQVSSSEAHRRVVTSLLFDGRPLRAKRRLDDLLKADSLGRWRDMFEILWAEFWDMHALFETSTPSFGYLCPETLEVLEAVKLRWAQTGDGPLVTMDAGPNVHLLFRDDQSALQEDFKKAFASRFRVWSGV